MNRLYQVLLIVSFIALSWLGFMVVHELGHVIVAWLTGGSVSRVVLHPFQISWTSFVVNPHPRAVAWGGPVLGCLLPLVISGIVRAFNWPGSYLYRFFAGFCLIANGTYLLFDAFERGGDGGTLLRHGASLWQLVAFAIVVTPVGFWLWNGLGPHFGFGTAKGKVSRSAAIISTVLLGLLVVAELALYRR